VKDPKPIFDAIVVLDRYPGKGGWTFAELRGLPPGKKVPFGSLRVKGSIDGHPILHYHLMPLGNGNLFLPVKAALRKILNKQEGDPVHVVLHLDDEPVELPADLRECLALEPGATERFLALPQGEQQRLIEQVRIAKREETRVERIAGILARLLDTPSPARARRPQ
jgi:hypothetical protein